MLKFSKQTVDSLRRIVIGVVGGTLLASLITYTYMKHFSYIAMEDHVQDIYRQLWVQTGQNQERIPLEVVDSPIINAYNNGNKIVIYTGLIYSTKSWDEIALVLGHEIAHGNLWHLKMLNKWKVGRSDLEIAVLEANADKLGAVYMMKAGYNICKGRELMKHWLIDNGDYQGGDHPGYAYRYNELNINCD